MSDVPPPWAQELPGYWVSLIVDNWRLRMVTPAKGDYIGIPLTAAAKKIADAWDPTKDEADGNQCRSYGAAAIMYRPERLQINWQHNKTLKMDIDDGMQTRLFHFESTASADVQPSWQGYSVAAWVARLSQGKGFPIAPNGRYLEVTTTRMLPGYLRQNGIPYSDQALVTEDYDMLEVSEQQKYLSVTTTVKDVVYLDYPLILPSIFAKEPNGAGWDPTPCSATW